MLLAILIIQTAALVAIALLAAAGKLRGPVGLQGPAGPQGPQGITATQGSAPGARRDLSQILTRTTSGEWQHHGWAETDSDAYRDALNRHGYAVRRHGEEIDPGVQA